MRITAIELENFKGIAERVRVELKPITLLFGANSAGKSTILHALLYLRDVLERRNLDAITTPVSGAALDLGGFRRFVHGRDLDRAIKIRVDMEVTGAELPEMARGSAGTIGMISSEADDDLEVFDQSQRQILQLLRSASVEIEVHWNTEDQQPNIFSYTVGLNGVDFCRIERGIDGLKITKLDLFEASLHNVLKWMNFEWTDFERSSGIEWPLSGLNNWLPNSKDPIPDFAYRETLKLHEIDWGKLPRSWGYSEIDCVELANYLALDGTAFLARLTFGPGKLVRDWLHDLRYIGPLRARPPRKGIPPVELGDWAEGLAAWKTLEQLPPEKFQEIGDWLSRKDRLNSGYGLTRNRWVELDADALDQVLAGRPTKTQLRSLLKNAPARAQINLLETRSGLELAPSEVGVGLSQVLPVVVAALDSPKGLVSIEQPELHIHPAIQVGLGDLFIEGALKRGTQFLIETHSEHLILRLLRRVRETTDGELPPGLPEVKPEHIGVLYVDNSEGEMRITPLPIDETGEFAVRWPQGFFVERGEELF